MVCNLAWSSLKALKTIMTFLPAGFTELLKRFSCTSKRSQDKAGTSSISGSVAVGNGARNQAMVIDDVKV